jgi:hypothetical protein
MPTARGAGRWVGKGASSGADRVAVFDTLQLLLALSVQPHPHGVGYLNRNLGSFCSNPQGIRTETKKVSVQPLFSMLYISVQPVKKFLFMNRNCLKGCPFHAVSVR